MARRRDIPLDVEMRQMLLSPLSLKDIAFRMNLAHGTLKIYCTNFYKMQGVGGRVEFMSREIRRLAGR